jgi:hypothetical protein
LETLLGNFLPVNFSINPRILSVIFSFWLRYLAGSTLWPVAVPSFFSAASTAVWAHG